MIPKSTITWAWSWPSRARRRRRAGRSSRFDRMRFVKNLRTSWRALGVHGLRSGLALLGIAIGTGALITMLALGAGARAVIAAQFQALGSNLLIVLSGGATSGGLRLGLGSGLTITQDDAAAIERE